MPNRILRDWTDSDKVEMLSCEAERFFVRLIMKVDDYGCYHADPKRLRIHLFPIKEISVKVVQESLSECVKASLVRLYSADEKDYLEIPNFHQRLRAMNRRFPEPTDFSLKEERESLEGRNQTCQTDDGQMTVNCQPQELLQEKRITEHDIYEAYPLKVARPVALAAIKKAMGKVSPEYLLDRTNELSRLRNGNKNLLPHPATWFNQERYSDDPTTWLTGIDANEKQPAISPEKQKLAARLGKLFKRGESEAWSNLELKAFHALPEITEQELATLERHYGRTIPQESDFRKNKLLSLLLDFKGAVDSARRFKEKPNL